MQRPTSNIQTRPVCTVGKPSSVGEMHRQSNIESVSGIVFLTGLMLGSL